MREPAYTLEQNFAGAEWLRAQGIQPSPLGAVVADVLAYVYGGLYHLDWSALKRADWRSTSYIQVSVVGRPLATVDGAALTMLVVLAHDLALRIDIAGTTKLYKVVLGFAPRRRQGTWDEAHPTLEEHAAKLRAKYRVIEVAPGEPQMLAAVAEGEGSEAV